MKVLLCEDVENLGWIGEVVDVKDGYARNYLLPYSIATIPTEGNVRALAEAKAKRAEERKLERKQMERACEAVAGAEAVIAAKANEQGHLFGSVSEKEIAENLRQQGFEISDRVVKFEDGHHIKEVGTHQVTLDFAAELSTTVSVVVVSQDETVESSDEKTEE